MTASPAYRRLVYATLVLLYLVVVWGGVVRVTGSGLGCPDWPLCHGQFLPSLDPQTRIEWLHRFLAILGGLSLAATSIWTLTRRRADRRAVMLVLISGPLYILQAVLGAITVLLELPHTWVTAHLANAELLLATLTLLAVHVRWPQASFGSKTRTAIAAAVGVYALMLTGAYVRGDDATTACAAWPLCDTTGLLLAGEAQLVHMAHRVAAVLVGVPVVLAGLAAWRRRDAVPAAGVLGVLVLALFGLQVLLGALNPLSGFAPWALGLHPAVASALWAATVALAAVLWRTPLSGRTVSDYVALTKPGVMSLLLLTAVGGTFVAARGIPPFHLVLATLIGGAAASGGAASLNHYFDRDIDLLMRRTSRRPVVERRVTGLQAIVFGIVLNVIAFVVLALVANVLAASLAIAGTLFYICVYTLWLKRTTVQNIVIGGAAGAFPPLVGFAAVTGSLDLSAWLLFAIIFFWTPAHFWALALLIKEDYARAGVPMMPVIEGDRATAVGILRYALVLVPLSALLFVVGAAGVFYLVAALVLGAIFVLYAVRLLRSADLRMRAAARTTYLFSLLYLALLFVAMMVDSTLTGLHLV